MDWPRGWRVPKECQARGNGKGERIPARYGPPASADSPRWGQWWATQNYAVRLETVCDAASVQVRHRVLAALVAAFALITFFLIVLPGVPLAVVSVPLDVVVNDSALIVGAGVIWLAALRFRETGELASGAVAAAFLVTTALNLMLITLQAGGATRAIGMSLEATTQEPLYLHSGVRLVAASTLFLGGLAAARHWQPRASWGWLFVPLGLALAVGSAVHIAWSRLPDWISPADLALVGLPGTRGLLPGTALPALLMQGAQALLLVGAAILYTGWRPRSGSPFGAYLAIALVIGAFGEVLFLAYPGSFSGLVSASDILRLAFATVLLAGIAADMRASSRALVLANVEVHRLRQAELAGAALAERAHLAREIHDGLSQHLWLAKLRTDELRSAEPDERTAARIEDLGRLIETSLAEAQQTVAALRTDPASLPLQDAISAFVEWFRAQHEVSVELEVGRPLPDVTPRVGAEVLRVVQEALSNAARHADATQVSIRLRPDHGRLTVEVHDNGVGFRPEAATQGFGLTSMRERVERIGGRFVVESAPSEGTTIRAEIPGNG